MLLVLTSFVAAFVLATCDVPADPTGGSTPMRAGLEPAPLLMANVSSPRPVLETSDAIAPEQVRAIRTDPEATIYDPEAAAHPIEGQEPEELEEEAPVSPETWPELDEVSWVTTEDKTLGELSSLWGVRYSTLLEYNPQFAPAPSKKRKAKGSDAAPEDTPKVPKGTSLVVFRKDPELPTRSIGAPNRGRLRSGIPLPEGPHWRLRRARRRTFGTHKTITSLLTALRAYGELNPEGPRVRIGELSARRGGRIYPHRSHRTGRDVDIGYLKLDDDPKRKTFRRTTRKNFDAVRNWQLVKALLDTGNVQAIYMSSRIQKLLYQEAKKHLPEEELRRIFQYPWHDESGKAILHHQRGHKHHLHVRFRCESWNRRCRARSRQKLKKRKSANS